MKYRILLTLSVLLLITAFWSCSTMQEHPSGKRVAFEVGAIAPNFEAKDLDGNIYNLWDLNGKKVILSFWATYDARSRLQLDDFQEFYNRMDKDKAVLLGLTFKEQEGDIIPLLQRRLINYPNIVDRHGRIGRYYGITIIENVDEFGHQIIDPDSARSFPVTVFINEDSTIEKIISVQISPQMLNEFAM